MVTANQAHFDADVEVRSLGIAGLFFDLVHRHIFGNGFEGALVLGADNVADGEKKQQTSGRTVDVMGGLIGIRVEHRLGDLVFDPAPDLLMPEGLGREGREPDHRIHIVDMTAHGVDLAFRS